jgi:hypothetical protein
MVCAVHGCGTPPPVRFVPRTAHGSGGTAPVAPGAGRYTILRPV